MNASVVADGRFESGHIGPWSGWLGDLQARVVVVGQDWGDARAFEKQGGRDSPDSATNRMLRELMAAAGLSVPEAGPNGSCGVFLTNAVLCFRTEGRCQGPVQLSWFRNCGTQFLRPQIDLIAPRFVICMGQRAYEAVLAAYSLPRPQNWRAAVMGSGVRLPSGPQAFAVYHCGRRILNSHRKEPQQLEDWRRLGELMRHVQVDAIKENETMRNSPTRRDRQTRGRID